MLNTGAGAHTLNIARADNRPGPEGVFVLECAVQHIGKDFHVLVGMARETGAGSDPIIIDDAKRTETHVRGIVVFREREGVAAVEPTVSSPATVSASSNGDHRPWITPRLVICRSRSGLITAPEEREQILVDRVLKGRAQAVRGEKKHLILEGVGAERSAVAENDRLAFTPVVVVDLRTVVGGNRAHGIVSFAR